MEMRPPFDGLPPLVGGSFDMPPAPDTVRLPQVPVASLGEQPQNGGNERTPDITAPVDRGTPEPVEPRAIQGAGDVRQPTEPTEVSEVAAASSHPVVEMLDTLHAEEVLGSPDLREELRREIDTDTAISHLNHVNALVRDIPPEDHEMDGMFGVNSMDFHGRKLYDPPAPEERPGLLAEAIEASKGLETEHGATLTGLAVNATHAWENGNGRTARFAYTVQTHGYDGSQEDRQLYSAMLIETKGHQVVDLNPARADLPAQYAERSREAIAENNGYSGVMPTSTIGGYDTMIPAHGTAGNIRTDPSVSHRERVALHEVITDPVFGSNALMRYVLENRDDFERYVDEGWEGQGGQEGQPPSVDLDELVPELRSDDINTITQMHADIRRGFVRDLIDTFTNPARRDEAQALVDLYRPAWRR